MNKINLIFYCLVVAICFSNCSKDPNDEELIINIDDEFIIDLREQNTDGQLNLHLLLETIAETNCTNSLIEYDYSFDKNTITIDILNIIEPQACDPGIAPAKASILLEDFQKDRDYSISINLSGQVFNDGIIRHSEQMYSLEMNNDDGIVLSNDKLYEIPTGTFWGYVAYEGEIEAEADMFFSELTSLTNTINYKDGYYGYFNVYNSSEIELDIQTLFPLSKPIIFNYTSDRAMLIDLLNSYRNDELLINDIEIKLFDHNLEAI